MGVDEGRVSFSWISASEGSKFAETINEVTEKVKQIGPNRGLVPNESGCSGCKE